MDLQHMVHNLIFLYFTALAAPFAFGPGSAVLPMVVIISVLLTYISILFIRHKDYQVAKMALVAAALTVATSIYRSGTSFEAFPIPGGPILPSFGVSAIISSLSIGAIFIATRLSPRFASPWSRVTLFPAVWATLWFTVSYTSPMGHLATWSAANNRDYYNWTIPFLGPASRDWIIAAWAVVISETFIQWFVDPPAGEYALLLSTSAAQQAKSNGRPTKILGLFLTTLLIPSVILSTSLPGRIFDIDASQYTVVSVGCARPSPRDKKHVLGLDDYIQESRTLARIVLWPEGAVSFDSAEARESAFTHIRKTIPWINVGVSFEETVRDPDDPTGRDNITRSGIAIVSQYSNDTHIYYKRHLVPGKEYHRLRYSTRQPTLFEVHIPKPARIPPTTWGPNDTRSLLLTSSIGFDFTMPSHFAALEARPSLILAPARTPEHLMSNSMWWQAKQRAAELNSVVLWCDGSERSVSGLAGSGVEEFAQYGYSGSFVRVIAIPYPFNSERTMYSRFGHVSLIFFWIPVVVGSGIPRIAAAIEYVREKRKSTEFPSIPEGNLLGD